jgi:hypothetical protein
MRSAGSEGSGVVRIVSGIADDALQILYNDLHDLNKSESSSSGPRAPWRVTYTSIRPLGNMALVSVEVVRRGMSITPLSDHPVNGAI